MKTREMTPVPTTIYRCGTSKGIFLHENDLPADPEIRDQVILSIFGSPDPRQIDGLGGAEVLTSKLAIIGPGSVAGADVDYTFGQVDAEEDGKPTIKKVAYARTARRIMDGHCYVPNRFFEKK